MEKIKIKERKKILDEYVKNRRGQEELMKNCSDMLVTSVYHVRKAATSLIALWKDSITRRRILFRQSLGLEE